MGKLFEELKRRKVVRVAGVYAVVAWLLIQVTNNIVPALQLPTWTSTFIVVLLLIGFPIALVLAWAYEVAPEGIRQDSTNQFSAHIAAPQHQKLIYAMFVLLVIAVGLQIADRFLAGSSSSNPNSNAGAIRANQPLPETRVDIVTPATESPGDFTLSPDGRQIVFVASNDSGVSQLWLRSLATTTAEPLVGSEGARNPFWSPDGRSIGFSATGALKRLDIGSSAAQTLTPISVSNGGTWGADNTLLFAPVVSSLMRISATGGAAIAVTTLEPRQDSHSSPFFLPDGHRFLFYAGGSPDARGIYLGHLDGTASVKLTLSDTAGVFHPDGWLLWSRAGTLTAQRLDLEIAALTGEPVILAEGVGGRVSVAATGLIAYRTNSATARQLTWVDRAGTVLGTLGEPDGSIRNPQMSPDGLRVAVRRAVQDNGDIWLLDGARSSRFTFDTGADVFPVWSPDGSQIVFRSSRTGRGDIYQKSSSGAREETLLISSDQIKNPSSWSADGRYLMYLNLSAQSGFDLWAKPMDENSEPFVVLQTPFDERWGVFSPDGRWFAYHSNESGLNEVYVRAFVAPDSSTGAGGGGVWQVSTGGGIYPAWSPDGQGLYYLDPVGNMMAAPVITTGEVFEADAPAELFPTRVFGGGTDIGFGRQYGVAPDGRFLINTVVNEGGNYPITLIQNWSPEAAQ